MADKDAGRIIITDAILAAGFVQVPMLVLRDPDLSTGAKVAYGALLWYAWRGGDYPGQAAMAEQFGMSERSVRSYLSELEKCQYVDVQRPGLGKPNNYIVLSPWANNSRRQNLPVKAATPAGQGGKICRSQDVLDSTNDIKYEYERPSTPTQEQEGASTHHNPTDSLSLSSIAYTASQRLNNGQQLRSILGFLEGRNGEPGFTLEIASQAFDHTMARHEDEPLNTPIAFFYKTCQLLRQKTMAEAETAKEERQRQFTVALSVAQLYLGDNEDIDAAYSAVQEYWPDLADPVIAELKNQKHITR